jgi:type I restriction enzyme M protein
MTEQDQKELGKTLWAIADQLRGSMNADDFRDYMLSFLFLRYLSANYEQAAQKELGADYPDVAADVMEQTDATTPLQIWYEENAADVDEFEKQMRRKVHYVIEPDYLWGSITYLAKTQSGQLLNTLQKGFNYIEERSFQSNFQGLFSEINLASDKLGRKYEDRNAKLCSIISELARGMSLFSTDTDTLGDAYEYLIGHCGGLGQEGGRVLHASANLKHSLGHRHARQPSARDGLAQEARERFRFACGSGSLLLNVRHRMKKAGGTISKIYGQEYNVTTYNLARMNMLLHGVKDTEFEIYHGDTLTNAWDYLRETNPAKKPKFDAVVANPPFSYRWEPTDTISEDMRFKGHGVAPKSAADFAFLLHGVMSVDIRGDLRG